MASDRPVNNTVIGEKSCLGIKVFWQVVDEE